MKKTNTLILSALFILTFFASPSFASEPEKLLKFADQLKASGEYYRAITEYNRFNNYGYGTENVRRQNMFKIADCFELGRQYSDAQNIYSEIANRYPTDRLLADIHRANLFSKEGKFGESNALIHSLLNQKLNPTDLNLLKISEAKNNVHLGDYNLAKNQFLDVALQGNELSDQARSYADTLERELPLKKKSKFAGMLLGVMIPGGGYFYIQKPTTALAALVVIGAFGYSTYELFDRRMYGLGSLTGLVTAGFYVGSLYGTAQGINKFNENKRLGLSAKFAF